MSGFPAPGVSAPSLQPVQMSYNGVTFAGYVAASPYQASQVGGIGLPPIGSGDVNRSRDHGSFAGLDVVQPRLVTANIVITTDGTSLEHAITAFVASLQPGGSVETPLYVCSPAGTTYVVGARIDKADFSIDPSWVYGQMIPGALQFRTTDPRIYSTPTTATQIYLDIHYGGLTFNATPNFVFGTRSASTATLTNTGSFDCRPQLVLTGPLTNPWIANTSYSATPTMYLAASGEYAVGGGDKVLIDMDYQSVTYYVGGMTSPSEVVSTPYLVQGGSTWWGLMPGANVVQFGSADAYDTGGSVTVQWASAWAALV